VSAIGRNGARVTSGGQSHGPDRLCAALNAAYGCPGAEAEHLEGAGYTGRVILPPQAVAQLIADRERITELEEHFRRVDGHSARAAEPSRDGDRVLSRHARAAVRTA
jgi:hypothetical protein